MSLPLSAWANHLATLHLHQRAEELVEEEAESQVALGYDEPETIYVLKIEYASESLGAARGQEWLRRLEAQLNETLGWTGLGHCAGGNLASGQMEAFCLVVDFELAREVVAADLKDTEFSDYSGITEDN